MDADHIIITGAREHNLKNINVSIPRNSLTIITGLSGSGKSTLAFDTLYAEGQRRYVESLSTYARQFLGQMDKPDVDNIEGLSPAIAIEQKRVSHNPRSTVGTVTEIYDFLRLLYAKAGQAHCHLCGDPIQSVSVDQMSDRVLSLVQGTKIILLSPLIENQKGNHKKLLASIKKQGYARVRLDGSIHLIDEIPVLNKRSHHTIEAVIDRLIIKDGIQKRLADSLELALSLSEGRAIVSNIITGEEYFFSETASCRKCNISYPEFTPATFSFNSPHGACTDCDGLGIVSRFDPKLIVPDPTLSLRQGAVLPWAKRNSVQFMEFLDALVSHYGADIYTPFCDLTEQFRKILFYGSGKDEINFYIEKADKKIIYKKPFEGIIPQLEQKLKSSDSRTIKDELKPFMSDQSCPTCSGSRLNPSASQMRFSNKRIQDLTRMSIKNLIRFFSGLNLTGKTAKISKPVIEEVLFRLGFLENVGLDYLTLARSADSLSGGESQRIRLATQIGSKLTGVLYVLDEPSIGLHPRDNNRLLSTLFELKRLGNTVLVVEHDHDTILASDYVIDIGPFAGINGGKLIFSGTPEALINDENSLTGQYLSGKKQIPCPLERRPGTGKSLSLYQACSNNLKNIDVHIPLGTFTCITGVSGSGKSTLVISTLHKILANRINHTQKPVGRFKNIKGLEYIDKVVHIDQSPIGKTPRSNPATYTQVFNLIRELFAKTKDARAKGYKSGRFSFNVKGGRCESCSGDGVKKIEMHFLPDVYVTCDVCKGKRYNRETLDVLYKGKNIDQILDMTINQAIRFFDNIAAIRNKLLAMIEVGLGYIKLGQPGNTLSGGESQRIKLARELSKKETGKTIYIMDEPTSGLHSEDIHKLLIVINRIVDAKNTVVVIEHNLDVIKSSDYIIDLGPEGGDKGGEIIALGTPEQVVGCKRSHTGFYLKSVLEDKSIRG